jgi:carbon-monoxide dehydrogenase catalytic subunit
MSEKAIAIGHYFVASGLYVVLGHPFYVAGSPNVNRFLTEEMERFLGRQGSGSVSKFNFSNIFSLL